MDQLVILRAEVADCPTLTEISKTAKAHWGYAQDWLALWDADLTITPALLQQGYVYKLVDQAKILGFCMIQEEGEQLEIEHLWIRPAYMGKGLGKFLLRKVLDIVISKRHVTLSVIADPNATGFYEKFGLKTVDFVPSLPEGRQLPLMRLPLHA